MSKKEKPPTIMMTDGKREIIRRLLSEYKIKMAGYTQNVLKVLLGGTIRKMMEDEMDYEKSMRSDSYNARNATNSSASIQAMAISAWTFLETGKSTFAQQIISKRKRIFLA